MTKEEAIKIIRSCNLDDDTMEVLTAAIPELRETESERIRKEIINYCYERLNTTYGALPNIESIKKWLAWLEKQGEQKPTKLEECVFRPYAGCDIESAAIQAVEQQKLGKKVVLAFNGAYIPVGSKTADDIVNEYYSWIQKQCEQKPTWSEEDEKMLDRLTEYIEWGIGLFFDENECNEAQAWLKSLKERLQPKQELSENAIVKDYIRDDKLWEKKLTIMV